MRPLPSGPLWSTPGPSRRTASGHWPPGSPSLWSVLSAAGRTPHGRSRGNLWGWGRCGCRWTAACTAVRVGSAMETGWTSRTGGADRESGGRLEVRMVERRQTLGFFQWQREMLKSGGFTEGQALGRGNIWSSSVVVSQRCVFLSK